MRVLFTWFRFPGKPALQNASLNPVIFRARGHALENPVARLHSLFPSVSGRRGLFTFSLIPRDAAFPRLRHSAPRFLREYDSFFQLRLALAKLRASLHPSAGASTLTEVVSLSPVCSVEELDEFLFYGVGAFLRDAGQNDNVPKVIPAVFFDSSRKWRFRRVP